MTAIQHPRSQTGSTERVVRVFVSSTFADMYAERDELVKFVFPELRKLCEQRQVTWGEVDLRWGVTDEQKAEGKVLPICLEEIKRCRPYFIGVLGERYGWIPEKISAELIEQEKWLAEHHNHSVTELEILHGVLLNPEMAEHAFFYFRDARYIDMLPADRQAMFRDAPTEEEITRWGRDEAEQRSAERHEKLAALKQRIRKKCFSVAENYPDPKAFGQLVLRDMQALIDNLYPDAPITDPLDREAAEHEAFADSRRRVYIGGDKYFQRLDEHADGDGQSLIVLGESGSGKSALLANWAEHHRKQHPDDLIILHFVGASSSSTDWSAMLRRIMGEFKRRFGITQEIPDKPDELRSAFANWLHMTAARGKVVLILDALNQLEDRDQAPDLVWLPPVIPANIRLVVSTLPGRSLDDLMKRDWPVMKVEPLNADERQEFILKYLAQYTKALSPERATRIADAKQTANPLYLRALLEELRVFGMHERLDERIGYYLAANTVPELYGKILARWEEDYEGDTNLVGDVMSLLWAARRGLSESELLDMLGSNGQPLPRAAWSPLYLAASDSLVSRSGLLGFFHDFLREAVRAAYLPTPVHERSIHLKIADYFMNRELTDHKVEELPWQLAEAKEWSRLYDLLAKLEFFSVAWKDNQWEVRAYWTRIEENSTLRMANAYGDLVADTHFSYLLPVSSLLADAGYVDEALRLRADLVEHFRSTDDIVNLSACLVNLAAIFQTQDDLDRAIALYKESERLCREVGNKNSLQASLNNQAMILQTRGDLDGAMTLYKESECLCREAGDNLSLSRILGNQAIILLIHGDLEGAMASLREQERFGRESGDKDILLAVLKNQAVILWMWNDLDAAVALLKETEHLCRELGNKYELSACLENQALILMRQGNLDDAMVLCRENEKIFRELGKRDSLQACLGNQGLIQYARGELDSAMALLQDQERLCRELGDKLSLSRSLGNQSEILRTRGDLSGAMALHEEEEQLCRDLANKDGLQSCLGNQALILYARGDLDGAMTLLKEQERLCQELGNPEGLTFSLGNQAEILMERNQGGEAQKLAESAYEMAIHHGLIGLAEETKKILDHVKSRNETP